MAAQNGPQPRDSTERRINALTALQDISRTLTSELNLNHLLEGRISIESVLGQGTTVSLMVPLPSIQP